ncbi:MAG: dihydropteroate synthase [Gammaproteobacteria bacterium]|nr:dihydropteroate synthase [Gammaproteobacteria bacterium]
MKPARIERPLLMGILNLTPDSFSNGGQFPDTEAAVSHALQMAEEGADLIDVGGESTRPGAGRLAADEQLKRVLPVLRRLRRELPAQTLISIDTTLAEVAGAALNAGASLINDVSAGRDDESMFALARERDVPIVLMHMQGTPATMQIIPHYEDAPAEVKAFLLARAGAAEAAGVPKDNILIDPGIGFGKDKRHNLELLADLAGLVGTGYSVMLGTSRKRFMGAICEVEHYAELVGATCATTALGVFAGVKIFRVHDVKANRQALDVAWAIKNRGAE